MSSKLQLDVVTTVCGGAIWWTRTKAKGKHGVVCRLNCVIHVWAPWGRDTCHLERYINPRTCPRTEAPLADRAFYTIYAHSPQSDSVTALVEFVLLECSCFCDATLRLWCSSSCCLAIKTLEYHTCVAERVLLCAVPFHAGPGLQWRQSSLSWALFLYMFIFHVVALHPVYHRSTLVSHKFLSLPFCLLRLYQKGFISQHMT